jgi:hypothetical protein
MEPRPAVGRRERRQLRLAARGVRRPRPVPETSRADEEVLALVETPYADVDEAEEKLRTLQTLFERRGDRRAIFLAIYARMTAAVADHIDRGTFRDPEWVGAYLVAFGNLYRAAVHAYEVGDFEALPTPWLLAFDAAARGDALVLQDASLGVNAHINYDLALALVRVGLTPDSAKKYADHAAVTDLIRDLVDEAQEGLVDRDAAGFGAFEESLGRVDEWLLVATIDECRDSAWRTAVALSSRFGPRRRLARWFNEATSTGAAHLILSSQSNGRVHDALRTFERGRRPDE